MGASTINTSAEIHPPESAAKRRSKKTLDEVLESSPGRYLLIFSLIFAVAELCSTSKGPFFIDEIIASYLGDLPSIGQTWPLIARGVELNPPLPFWIMWIVHHTIGGSEVAGRLPSIAGFWLMCFCLYHFVRRRSSVLFGFAAFLLPLFTYTQWAAMLARGYGLMLGASAAALLCWQLAADRIRRPLALAGLAAGLAVAVSCHYYALYVPFALCIGEAVRTWQRRHIDFPVWAALAAGVSPLLAYAPLLRMASKGATHNFWISPDPVLFYESYADLLGPITIILFLMLALVSWVGWSGEKPRWMPATLGSHEVVACLVLMAMPLAIFIPAFAGAIPFYPRYVMPVVIGFTVVAAVFAYRIGGGSGRFRELVATLMVWFCFAPWALFQVSKLGLLGTPASQVASRFLPPAQPSLPIVMDSEGDLELYYYGSPELRAKIFYLLDEAAAVKYRGSDTAMRSIRIMEPYRGLHAVPYRDFIAHHREFIVLRHSSEGWVVQKVLADGARVELVSLQKDPGFNVKNTLLFRVTFPDPPKLASAPSN